MVKLIILFSLLCLASFGIFYWSCLPILRTQKTKQRRSIAIGIIVAAFAITVSLYIKLGQSKLMLALETDNTQALAKSEITQMETLLKSDPDNPDLLLKYLSAKAMINHGKLDEDSLLQLDHLLEKQPDSFLANQMIATNDYLNGRYDMAIARWKKMRERLAQNPEANQEAIELFDDAIKKAEKKL